MRKGCLSPPGNLEKQPKIFNLETIHKAFHKYDNIFSQQLIIVKQYCQKFICFQARCIKSGLDCRFIYVWLYFQAWCSTCLDNNYIKVPMHMMNHMRMFHQSNDTSNNQINYKYMGWDKQYFFQFGQRSSMCHSSHENGLAWLHGEMQPCWFGYWVA